MVFGGRLTSLQHAAALLKEDNKKQAITLLQELAKKTDTKEPAFRQLLRLALAEQHWEEAKNYVVCLQQLNPSSREYRQVIMDIGTRLGDFAFICAGYERYLQCHDTDDTAHFNCGYYARKARRPKIAIAHFKRALELGIKDPHEVHLNLALVYSELLLDPETAQQWLGKALELKPDYVDALFNFAAIKEFAGDRRAAKQLFEQVLTIDAQHPLALSRLADLDQFNTESAHNYVTRCQDVMTNMPAQLRCDLHYSCGKALDDAKLYEQAWMHYYQANTVNKQSLAPFNVASLEHTERNILARAEHISQLAAQDSPSVQPIIICGMFRSGSTLVEQILGASGCIQAGGELEFVHRQLFELTNKPTQLLNKAGTPDFAQAYDDLLVSVAKGRKWVTDKRPENYLYIDILKQLYPGLKVIWTQRDIRDNALSAYFQRLGPSLNYATDLDNIRHMYEHQQRLKAHWHQQYGNDIMTVEYEQLVAQPEQVLTTLFSQLGIQYDGEAERFHNQRSHVRTASVWQVRKPLYSSSVGRFKHYKEAILAQRAFPYFSELL